MATTRDGAIKQLYENVGSRVRAARERGGVTQLTLGQKIGLTRSSIANLERGYQRIPLHVLALVADALDVRLLDLIPDSLPNDDTGTMSEVKGELSDAPESARRFIEGAVRQLGND